MSLSVALGVPLASPIGSGGGASVNPNLLLWTEELDDPVWTATDASVLADQSTTPLGARSQAEEIQSLAATSAVRQVTTTAATTGGASAARAITGLWARYSVTGVFDGQSYTFSVYLRDTGVAAAPSVTLRIDRSGGFLRCSLEDPVGDGDYLAWGAQLEAAASASAYQSRTT